MFYLLEVLTVTAKGPERANLEEIVHNTEQEEKKKAKNGVCPEGCSGAH